VPGYKYRLYNREGDEIGTYQTLAWNWTVGDTLEMHSGRGRLRIAKFLDLDESDDSSGEYRAAFMVERAQETIIHDVPPKWFCRCEGPDGMVSHTLDEQACPVCGATPTGRTT
jgi:hypothetical protein